MILIKKLIKYLHSQTLCCLIWNAFLSEYAPAYNSDLLAGGAEAKIK